MTQLSETESTTQNLLNRSIQSVAVSRTKHGLYMVVVTQERDLIECEIEANDFKTRMSILTMIMELLAPNPNPSHF